MAVLSSGQVRYLSQSNVILFCLLAAFLVFVTLRGELPRYLQVIFGTVSSGSGTASTTNAADPAASVGGILSDPIGAATGAIRRDLGIGNGVLPNLPSIGSSLGGLF